MLEYYKNVVINKLYKNVSFIKTSIYLIIVAGLYIIHPLTICLFSLPKLNWFTLIIVFILVQLYHIFFYFTTIYQNSKYTSVIKFFWIRVFTIFWGMEFYLFGIFMFLFIIAPAELYVFWDEMQLRYDRRTPNISITSNYIITAATIFNINVIGYSMVYKNKIVTNLMVLPFIFFLLHILLKEFDTFYNSNLQYYYRKEKAHLEVLKSDVIVLENHETIGIDPNLVIKDKKTTKPIIVETFLKWFDMDEVDHHKPRFFILNVILTIKFLHVYVIVILNLFFLYILLNSNHENNIQVLGVWQQNLNVMLIFWAANYVIYYKITYKKFIYGIYKTSGVWDVLTNWYTVPYEFYLI